MTESNCHPRITKPMFYHLTNRAWIGGNGEIRTHGAISDPTVFKTVAINQTLPRFHKLVEDERIELSISACKADVIPFN